MKLSTCTNPSYSTTPTTCHHKSWVNNKGLSLWNLYIALIYFLVALEKNTRWIYLYVIYRIKYLTTEKIPMSKDPWLYSNPSPWEVKYQKHIEEIKGSQNDFGLNSHLPMKSINSFGSQTLSVISAIRVWTLQ